MKKVFLIGYMGVGKTTMAKRLGNALGIPFFDLDHEIVEMESQTINELFAKGGELHFRELESRLLKDFCSRKDSFVLSTGGGTATSPGNIDAMKAAGIVVWLDLPVDVIMSRLRQSADRPLLKDLPQEAREEFIKMHFAERLPRYQEAHIKFDASNVNAARLADLVREIQSK